MPKSESPAATSTYPTLRLKPGRERSLHNRHPWLFSGALEGAVAAQTGDIVEVVGADGRRLGYGHYLRESQIVCRLFSFSTDAQTFDHEYWYSKLQHALAWRRQYLNLEHTTGYRLVNAEGDLLPGLIVDVYGETAVLQLRTPGIARILPVVLEFLQQEVGIRHVLEKGVKEEAEDEAEGSGNRWLLGNKPEVMFTENGLRFKAQVEAGQKTGFFLDQRDSRALVEKLCAGRMVLNAFGYSGAFAAYALRGGAAQVTSVDISASATALAEETMTLNGLADRHMAVTGDCFDYLRALPPNSFDAIILDPPAFTKHISTVDKASRGYKDINLKAMSKLKPGGLLFTFSCSQHISRDLFRKIVFGAAADARRAARILYQTGHAVDHPIDIYHPEGEYLKGLVLQID